jgi:hypothetical protein
MSNTAEFLIQLLTHPTNPYSPEAEENGPKTESFTISNFKQAHRLCDFILRYLALLSSSSYYNGFKRYKNA